MLRCAACTTRLLVIGAIGAALAGCQNGRAAVIPPPGGALNRPDVYYTPPAAGQASIPYRPGSTEPRPAGKAVSLAPGSAAPKGTRTTRPADTYDVASRVAADNQPIRVLESTSRSPASFVAGDLRGMPVNDGTNTRSWHSAGNSSTLVDTRTFQGLRGGSIATRPVPSQSLSGQDGRWKARSSYEATERR